MPHRSPVVDDSAMFNLSLNRDNFAHMAAEGVPKALVSMLTSRHRKIRSVSLSTLVFFSCLSTPRAKLLDVGIVPAITKITAESPDLSAGQRLRCVPVAVGAQLHRCAFVVAVVSCIAGCVHVCMCACVHVCMCA